MFVLLITRLLQLVGRLESRKPVQPHQLGCYLYPSDRPKSVRNRCVIEVFGGFVLSRCFFDFSVGVARGFCLGLSQISSFFSD